MQRVVAIFGVEADFNIVLLAFVPRENAADFVAEVAFDFEDQAADALSLGLPLCRRGFARRTDTCSRWSSRLPTAPKMAMPVNSPRSGIGQPLRCLGGDRFARVMNFANDQRTDRCVVRNRDRAADCPAAAAEES